MNVSLLYLNVPGRKFVCNPLTPAIFIIVKITDVLQRPLQNTLQWKHTEAYVDHATKMWMPMSCEEAIGKQRRGASVLMRLLTWP